LTILVQAGQAWVEDRHAATAASRTRPWLPSGWGCRGRRLSRA
jgi:hypothetical protein